MKYKISLFTFLMILSYSSHALFEGYRYQDENLPEWILSDENCLVTLITPTIGLTSSNCFTDIKAKNIDLKSFINDNVYNPLKIFNSEKNKTDQINGLKVLIFKTGDINISNFPSIDNIINETSSYKSLDRPRIFSIGRNPETYDSLIYPDKDIDIDNHYYSDQPEIFTHREFNEYRLTSKNTDIFDSLGYSPFIFYIKGYYDMFEFGFDFKYLTLFSESYNFTGNNKSSYDDTLFWSSASHLTKDEYDLITSTHKSKILDNKVVLLGLQDRVTSFKSFIDLYTPTQKPNYFSLSYADEDDKGGPILYSTKEGNKLTGIQNGNYLNIRISGYVDWIIKKFIKNDMFENALELASIYSGGLYTGYSPRIETDKLYIHHNRTLNKFDYYVPKLSSSRINDISDDQIITDDWYYVTSKINDLRGLDLSSNVNICR